jgi:sulfopyruvate decarboxylase subunit alpha
MPVSTDSSRAVYAALKDNGIKLVSALPETWLVHLIRMAEEDEEMILVRLAKEEEGVGVSMGAHLAGTASAMLMQNHGFFAAINAVISGAQQYRIPLLMLISDRGSFGEPDPWQTEGGLLTTHVLESMRVPTCRIDDPDDAAARIADAQTLANSSLRPVAVLLGRDLMWESP